MLTDTHAHLDFPDFAADLGEVLARAEAAGVRRIITISTTIEGSRQALALAERYPQVWATVGVHPNAAQEAPDDVLTPLRELATHPRVVALGECGMDFHRRPESRQDEGRAKQASVFRQQLDLAVELGLPVVVHERDAWTDTLAQLDPYTGKVRAVFHCFGKSFEQAGEVLALGHLVSFTGIVTFKNAVVLHDCVARVPAGSFMVETDCPFLAPVPFRGKRCEPAHVRTTAERIATLRGATPGQVAADTEATANRFFRFTK